VFVNTPWTLPAPYDCNLREDGKTVNGPFGPLPGSRENVTVIAAVSVMVTLSTRVNVAVNGPGPNSGEGMVTIWT
jgi:hypothetical protein